MSTIAISVSDIISSFNPRESAKRFARLQVKGLLRHFISKQQLAVMLGCLDGEEWQFFSDKFTEYFNRIETMPASYEQDGKGDEAIAYLHYFKGACDWYILEKDKGCEDDAPEDKGVQFQAFGWANLGDDQNAELGYIPIQELIECNVDFDLHFTPKKLGDIINRR